jgi:hypothetical protein
LIAWLFILRSARNEQATVDSSFDDSLSCFRESMNQFRITRNSATEAKKGPSGFSVGNGMISGERTSLKCKTKNYTNRYLA